MVFKYAYLATAIVYLLTVVSVPQRYGIKWLFVATFVFGAIAITLRHFAINS